METPLIECRRKQLCEGARKSHFRKRNKIRKKKGNQNCWFFSSKKSMGKKECSCNQISRVKDSSFNEFFFYSNKRFGIPNGFHINYVRLLKGNLPNWSLTFSQKTFLVPNI